VEKTEEGYRVVKNGEELGIFKDVKSIEEGRIVFKKDRGMLFEVTPKGHRDLISEEKARLLAGICSDGAIWMGKDYGFKFINADRGLLDLFKDALREVYGISEVHEVENGRKRHVKHITISRKDLVEDIRSLCQKKGASYWRAPTSLMDKNAAREFLKFFFSGDGTFDVRPHKNIEIRIKSKSLDGLKDLQKILKEFFEIESRIRGPYVDKHGRIIYLLSISSYPNIRKFYEEIGSYKEAHQKHLKAIKKWLDEWKNGK